MSEPTTSAAPDPTASAEQRIEWATDNLRTAWPELSATRRRHGYHMRETLPTAGLKRAALWTRKASGPSTWRSTLWP